MQGDFTRGHRPDGKRGQRFLRSFAGQQQVLLDSDLNAGTDALHERLRELANDAACPKGSPDLGYLITPGRLLALFENLEDVVASETNVTVYRDYSRKYLERYPSVRIAADQGAAGSAVIRLRGEATGAVRFHVRSDAATTATLSGGVALAAPAGDDLQPVEVTLAGPLTELQVDLDAGESIWIGLIEARQDAGAAPSLWVAGGRFYLDGLPLVEDEDGAYPEASFPIDAEQLLSASLAALVDGDQLIAYLEGWERHITPVEDAGLREPALGGLETATRGQSVGQVKLVRIGAGADVDALARAISEPALPTGTLEIASDPPPPPDPCALPLAEGYTGPDNRLYRFEVHVGGGLGEAVFKWSRDNASELYASIEAPAPNQLVFARETELRAGDIVEALNDAIDLGDQAVGAVAGSSFTRPRRAVGPLALLEDSTSPNGRAFTLRQLDSAADLNLDADVFGPFPGGAPIKVRRWHGRILTTGGVTEYDLEHGISITLGGEFEPGDYWQYEGRVGGGASSGDFQETPHGPLRVFSPLALLEFDAATEPLQLLRWLDDRFSPLCELNADEISFDGERVESESTTVQEALEELFEQGPEIIEAGCGELVARTENGLQNVFDTIPDGGDARVCIQPAVRNLTEAVVVANKGHVIVSGTGEGVQLVRPGAEVLRFTGCRRVEIRDLRIEGLLQFTDCEEVVVEGVRVIQAGANAAIRITSPASTAIPGAHVRLHGNRIRAGVNGDGVFVLNAERVDIENNDIEATVEPFSIPELLATTGGPAAIANVIMDRVFLDLPPDADDDIFLSSSVVQFGTGPWGRPLIVAGVAAPSRVFYFTTHRLFSAEIWEDILEQNPIDLGNAPADGPTFAALRRLRRNLARRMFDLDAPVTIPDSAQGTFVALRRALELSATETWGHAGVTVAANRAQPIPFSDNGPANGGVFNRIPCVRVVNNRIGGFSQGVHVGASFGNAELVAHIVHVVGNSIALRVPLFAYERHGIFVGSAGAALVGENAVEVIAPSRPDWLNSLPPTDGIRLWGQFGPQITVKDNLNYGVTTGVRVRNLQPTAPGAVRAVADNGYFFDPSSAGTPESIT